MTASRHVQGHESSLLKLKLKDELQETKDEAGLRVGLQWRHYWVQIYIGEAGETAPQLGVCAVLAKNLKSLANSNAFSCYYTVRRSNVSGLRELSTPHTFKNKQTKKP